MPLFIWINNPGSHFKFRKYRRAYRKETSLVLVCLPPGRSPRGGEHDQYLVQGSIVHLCSELKCENGPRVVLWQQQNGMHIAVSSLLSFHASLDSIHHFTVYPAGGLPQGP